MSRKTNREMHHKYKSSFPDSIDVSEQIINLKYALDRKRSALKSKTVAQNRFKNEKALVNSRARLNTIVEGENQSHIYGLPNEIWELVFENFDDAADIQNCFNTCQQFRSSCSSSQKTLIQMRKILPILFKTGYLTHNEILKIRLVSKPLDKFVNRFFQSKKLSWQNSTAPIEYDLIPYCYNCSPLEILMQDTLLNVSKGRALIRYQVLNHPQTRNPFLSRYLMIHDNTGLTLDRFRRWDEQSVEFLKCWGSQIWYLTFRMNCSKLTFLNILKEIPNLKHLKITGSIRDDGSVYQSDYSKLLEEACPKLNSLVFPGTTKYIMGVHNNLISAFSGKLEEFQVEIWESLYSEFYWPQLKKLVIGKVNWLPDLCNCRADNLVELRVCLGGNENFDVFLKMVNNFPRLEVLEVNFGKRFEMKDEEVIRKLVEDNRIDNGEVFVSKVKSLSLKIQCSDNISFSILAWFPMLEFLEIEKEFGKEDKHVDCSYENKRKKIVDDKKEKEELVEIEKFLCKNREGTLDKSNIWKMFPFLRKIKINNLTYDTTKVFSKPLLR